MKEYVEKNKDTLNEAIADLPTYQPPQYAWEGIERSLDRLGNMQQALLHLPQHAAPSNIWKNIEQALDAPQQLPRPTVHRTLSRLKPWIAAATLCGLALGAWWFMDNEQASKTTIAYSEEVQMQINFAMDWEEEDETIEAVMTQAEQSPVADPQVIKRLKLEYHELNDARTEVEEMLKRYGQDDQLLKEVARIERERSQVIKELATWI